MAALGSASKGDAAAAGRRLQAQTRKPLAGKPAVLTEKDFYGSRG
jgi:hypothetical protein